MISSYFHVITEKCFSVAVNPVKHLKSKKFRNSSPAQFLCEVDSLLYREFSLGTVVRVLNVCLEEITITLK